VLAATVSNTSTEEAPSYKYTSTSIMILYSGLERYCLDLDLGSLNPFRERDTLSLKIQVGPICFEKQRRYKDNMRGFFSEITQKALLHPFLIVRAIDDVEIRGCVLLEVATTVKNKILKGDLEDPEQALNVMDARKEEGVDLYRKEKYRQASLLWAELAWELAVLPQKKAWRKKLEMDGSGFLDRLADLTFKTFLNWMQACIKN
jgi:hypothetical protein